MPEHVFAVSPFSTHPAAQPAPLAALVFDSCRSFQKKKAVKKCSGNRHLRFPPNVRPISSGSGCPTPVRRIVNDGSMPGIFEGFAYPYLAPQTELSADLELRSSAAADAMPKTASV